MCRQEYTCTLQHKYWRSGKFTVGYRLVPKNRKYFYHFLVGEGSDPQVIKKPSFLKSSLTMSKLIVSIIMILNHLNAVSFKKWKIQDLFTYPESKFLYPSPENSILNNTQFRIVMCLPLFLFIYTLSHF